MPFPSPLERDEATDVRALLPVLTPAERVAALSSGRALVAGARARADERPLVGAGAGTGDQRPTGRERRDALGRGQYGEQGADIGRFVPLER